MANICSGAANGRMPNGRVSILTHENREAENSYLNGFVRGHSPVKGDDQRQFISSNNTTASSNHQENLCAPQSPRCCCQQQNFGAGSLIGTDSISESQSSGQTSATHKSDETPMSLMANLLRYNKLLHQYKLVNEGGPAHEKIFTVALIIGGGAEEYIAEGPSIKKAQQAAAFKALQDTKLPRPPSQRSNHKRRATAASFGFTQAKNESLTPTVTLNALASKLGCKPQYMFLPTPGEPGPPRYPPAAWPPPPQGFPIIPPNFSYFSYNRPPPRFFHGCPPFPPPPVPPVAPIPVPVARPHYVTLRIGPHEFIGQGPNRQLAKHDASLKALRALEPKIQRRQNKKNEPVSEVGETAPKKPDENLTVECKEKDELAQDKKESVNEELPTEIIANENKSPISAVYELALQKSLDVTFEIFSESGPAHNRQFVVRCTVVGPQVSLIADGGGASKKSAKHEAAEKMVQLLKQQGGPLPTPSAHKQQRQQKDKRKRPTIIKDMKSDPNYGQQINPVSRLIQVQQTRQQAEPLFEFVRESGTCRYKEFVMQVTVGSQTCEGSGPNKKLAKRAAAEAMLDLMGFTKPLPKPGKPLLKHHQNSPSPDDAGEKFEDENHENDDASREHLSGASDKQRKVKFQLHAELKTIPNREDMQHQYKYSSKSRSHGRQLAPGLLFMPGAFSDGNENQSQHDDSANQTTPTLATLTNGEDSPNDIHEQPQPPQHCGSAKEQLQYLSNLLSFQIQFTDFPKNLRNGESGDYLSLVSLSINPPLVCHGSGPSVQDAQHEASLNALRALADKGLQATTFSKRDTTVETSKIVNAQSPTQPLSPNSCLRKNGHVESLALGESS